MSINSSCPVTRVRPGHVGHGSVHLLVQQEGRSQDLSGCNFAPLPCLTSCTHTSRSPWGSSPHPGYLNCASQPQEGLSNWMFRLWKKIGSDVGFLNTQQPKFNQNQMLGESKEFLLAPACVDSCDSTTALVLKTACTHCNASDITLHKDTAWKTSAQIWDYCVMNCSPFYCAQSLHAPTKTRWLSYGKQRLFIITYLHSLDYVVLQFPFQMY